MCDLSFVINNGSTVSHLTFSTAARFKKEFEEGSMFSGSELIEKTLYSGVFVPELSDVTTQEAYEWMCSKKCDWMI